MGYSIEQLYSERQAKFVESRTITESEVNRFLQSLETLDPVYQQELGVVAGQTARDVLPALWADPFVEADYLQQKAVFDQRVAAATALANKLNAEALQCLQA